MQDTTAHDDEARRLAEIIHAAYARQASGPIHPQHEQTLLARLAEAIGPALGLGSTDAVRSAANSALDGWEKAVQDTRGPRVERIEPDGVSVTLAQNRRT